MIKADTIWFDGELVPWDACNVHVMTHTLHYGLGVFEGIRAYTREDGRSAIFRLRDHLQRLIDSAKLMTLPLSWTLDELTEACVETCVANKLRECYLRPIAFVGYGAMGLGAMENPTHTAIAVWPWGAYLGDEGLTEGVRIKTSTFTRPHINSQMHKGKVVGHYVNSILAKREAILDGYAEAVLLDAQGYVAECSGENLFVVKDGAILTPPYGGPQLGGITRDTVITLAREAGFEVREQHFTRDVMYLADEVFMVGTAAEVTPVREIDRRAIGEGARGPVTERLQSRYFDVVKGADTQHEAWLTYYDVPA